LWFHNAQEKAGVFILLPFQVPAAERGSAFLPRTGRELDRIFSPHHARMDI